jgi:hypothetical protein
MAHDCNPNYFEGLHKEDCGLRPDQANDSRDSIFKITTPKWPEGMAQVSMSEYLLCNLKVLS